MKTETKEVYRYDHCKKMYVIKHYAVAHEESCRKNPKNEQDCLSCGAFEMRQVEIMKVGYNDVEYHQKYDLGFCKKKLHYVYPYWCNNPVSQEDIPQEIENNPMPMLGKCSDKRGELEYDLI